MRLRVWFWLIDLIGFHGLVDHPEEDHNIHHPPQIILYDPKNDLDQLIHTGDLLIIPSETSLYPLLPPPSTSSGYCLVDESLLPLGSYLLPSPTTNTIESYITQSLTRMYQNHSYHLVHHYHGGSHGSIYRGIHRESNKPVIFKILKISHDILILGCGIREVYFAKQLQNLPHISRYLGSTYPTSKKKITFKL